MKRTLIFRMFSTHTKICIIGGGTAGLNLSTHLLRGNVRATDIRIFDAAEQHYYQPGWTMVGAGLCGVDLTQRNMSDLLPKDIYHTKQNVAKVDADNKQLTTANGQQFTYDQLVFASGFQLNWDKIKGAKEALNNPNSYVGSIYYKTYAEKLAKIGSNFQGGTAIFIEPILPIKCAGAPQKILYLWSDIWEKKGILGNVQYLKAGGVMFGVPKYSAALTKIAKDYGITTTFKHNLVEVKDKENIAVFQNLDTKERVEKQFSFLHLIPPMSAHAYIAQSGLADSAGFLDVDKSSLRHTKYNNVWGLGDCTSTPNSKTAAAVFSQTETVVQNLLHSIRNSNNAEKLENLPSKYEGYSSCPLFTGDGKLMLAEFKYGGQVDETFLADQQKPRRFFYWLKRFAFPHIYWHLVPRGLWGGRKGLKIDI